MAKRDCAQMLRELVSIPMKDLWEELGLDPMENVSDFMNRIKEADQPIEEVDQPETSTSNQRRLRPNKTVRYMLYLVTEKDKAAPSHEWKRLMELVLQERSIIMREVRLIRQEFDMFTRCVSFGGKPMRGMRMDKVSIMTVSRLVNDFTGFHSNFEQWAGQIRQICATYELDDSAARYLIKLRLKGEAQTWFLSRPGLMHMNVYEILHEMRVTYGGSKSEGCVCERCGHRQQATKTLLSRITKKLVDFPSRRN